MMLNSTAVMNTESITKRQERNAHLEDVVGQLDVASISGAFVIGSFPAFPATYLFFHHHD